MCVCVCVCACARALVYYFLRDTLTNIMMTYIICVLAVNELEKGVIALHLPIGPLKTRFVLDPVPGCEPSTYQFISR